MADAASPTRDLARMLATLDARVRPGAYVYVARPAHDARLAAAAEAAVREHDGTCYVVERDAARALGVAPADNFVAAWIALGVHSALDAVGLTAAFARALADRGIACNVIAGLRHDHLLVPHDRVDEALDALRALQAAHA